MLIVIVYQTFQGIFNFVRYVSLDLARGGSGDMLRYFITESTGVFTPLLLLPFVLLFVYRYPINKTNFIVRIPMHLLASMIFGASHTLLMFWSRRLIFGGFDIGDYNYGILRYQFVMEYTLQFLSYSFWYACVHLYKFFLKHQEQKMKTANLENLLTQAQLQALQMQIHPHFLFNTLNMISSIMYKDTKTADKMIANLSDLLRISLNNKGSKIHTLEQELETANYYVEIMKARFAENLTIKFNMDKGISHALMPEFFLQPLIENSIKYGMKESTGEIQIDVSVQKKANRLRLLVLDNGPGIHGQLNDLTRNGIGLSNIIARLKMLYENEYTFELENKASGGLCVCIEIPFKESETN